MEIPDKMCSREGTMNVMIVILVAMVAAVIVVAVSPLLRAICWSSIFLPRHTCVWEKDGDQVRKVS